jgi:hypothetical protein
MIFLPFFRDEDFSDLLWYDESFSMSLWSGDLLSGSNSFLAVLWSPDGLFYRWLFTSVSTLNPLTIWFCWLFALIFFFIELLSVAMLK